MKGSRDAKPPPRRPAAERAQPARARPEGVTADIFSRFVGNLARLERGQSQSARNGEGGR